MKKVRVGIVGVTGYSGFELIKLLLKHPYVDLVYTAASKSEGNVTQFWPELSLKTNLEIQAYDPNEAVRLCDVIFLATPHTISMKIAHSLLAKSKKIIDLSGDYRLADAKVYSQWYGQKHSDKESLKAAVYGLPEVFAQEIKKAQLVSNPGCYPTGALLALAPLLSKYPSSILSIIIDAKSGVTGAGIKSADALLKTNKESFKAYKILSHQHTPEIEQYASEIARKKIKLTFVTHLLPIKRGIFTTIYVKLQKTINEDAILTLYKDYYQDSPFVHIVDKPVEIKDIVGTNRCNIALYVDSNTQTLILTSVIDNLLKGASGQAIQNMNIMLGIDEKEGLTV